MKWVYFWCHRETGSQSDEQKQHQRRQRDNEKGSKEVKRGWRSERVFSGLSFNFTAASSLVVWGLSLLFFLVFLSETICQVIFRMFNPIRINYHPFSSSRQNMKNKTFSQRDWTENWGRRQERKDSGLSRTSAWLLSFTSTLDLQELKRETTAAKEIKLQIK